MLSYGAAVPSLYLLQRFNLLQILLPFHVCSSDDSFSREHDLDLILARI